ncbi:ABA4-like family protein [Sorangium sp. So ce693]|uniref:ABA4-like family protein n=1 Tax=Sorangium sp. So ce693 TaxID=3133318 RepID=UPI003F613CB8
MMDKVFGLSGLLVLPFWFLMIFLPRARWTRRIMESPLVVVAPALLYTALVLPAIGEVLPIVNQPSLAAVAPLLGSPAGATIGWVHFLTFDLFVGRWVYLDSRDRDISPWLMAPVLYLTLMLGPMGFSLYLAVRAIADRSARALDRTVAQRRVEEA